METKDKIRIAKKHIEKGYSYTDLKYGDDLYSYSGEEKEQLLDEIYNYMEEYKSIGSVAFAEKYNEYKLY